mmetsp:Transcript_3783/g.9216  ORF Transcript_3783/g.9216 Transcript_3783/m.9216 type:complete len:258 (-) Transcript_3783:923-1696(-)
MSASGHTNMWPLLGQHIHRSLSQKNTGLTGSSTARHVINRVKSITRISARYPFSEVHHTWLPIGDTNTTLVANTCSDRAVGLSGTRRFTRMTEPMSVPTHNSGVPSAWCVHDTRSTVCRSAHRSSASDDSFAGWRAGGRPVCTSLLIATEVDSSSFSSSASRCWYDLSSCELSSTLMLPGGTVAAAHASSSRSQCANVGRTSRSASQHACTSVATAAGQSGGMVGRMDPLMSARLMALMSVVGMLSPPLDTLTRVNR